MDQDYAHFIFSKFEEVKFDPAGWKYVVPETVAECIARPYRGKKILDAYAGLGGNTIQFALNGNEVISLESYKKRFLYLQHNCRIYEVDERADLRNVSAADCGLDKETFDVVYLDPPWETRDFDPGVLARPYLKNTEEVLVKMPKEASNEFLLNSGAAKILEIYVNRSPFLKIAYYFSDNRDGRTVEKEIISYPKLSYIFP